jgi:hypothetical protein
MSYLTEVLADTPLIFWRLGEASGATATDASGNSRNGTYNGTFTYGATGALTGDADTAVTSNGSTGYVSRAAAAAIDLSSLGAFSVECWLSNTDIDRGDLFSKGNHRIERMSASFGEENIRFTVDRATSDAVATTADIKTTLQAGYVHVVCTWDGTTPKIYINGAEASYGTQTGGSGAMAADTANNLYLFGGPFATVDLAATADEFALYGAALSAARVLVHYQAGTGTLAGGPDAPTNLVCGAVTSSTIALTWDDNADDEDGFHLQYDIVNTFDSPVQIDLDSADTETDTVLSLAPETEYFFRVRAYNGDGNSDWSNTDSAITSESSPSGTPTVGAPMGSGLNLITDD